jgi:aminoglycoside phosphotransferase (APT) family kinase protein
MADSAVDLPPPIVDWVARTGAGRIAQLARHVARREAWVVDVARPDGSVLEGFLRLERAPRPGDPWSLRKETRIVEALGRTEAVPVPRVHGYSDELHCALFERVSGRADLDKVADTAQQRAVMEDFIRILARLHTLELDALGLDADMAYIPATPERAALAEVDLILERWSDFLRSYTEPLLTYGVEWLRRNAPRALARVSLVQGDTGPVNFLFEDRRVRALVDWEWGHYGDPLEDLGNLCVREFWNPSGGLTGLFRLYEKESGIPYTRFAAQYYRVHQNVRGMVPIHAVTAPLQPREPVAWFLAYRYVGDRATCEALAEAMGLAVQRPELPEDGGGDDVLVEAARHALEHDVAPGLADPYARSRAVEVRILMEVMERRHRFGAKLAALERDELGALLGRRPRGVLEGLRALDRAIRERSVDEERLVHYLTRRSYRDEWLHAPAVALYPERRWSPLD